MKTVFPKECIRQITETDIPGFYETLSGVIAEGRYLGFLEPPPYEGTVSFVRNNIAENNPQIIAISPEDNSKVLGWCDIIPTSSRPLFRHIGHLGTGLASQYRGRGIGKQLLQAAIEAARSRGLTRIELDVYCSNERAIKLYQSLGFEIEGRKRGHARFPDRVEDSFFMARLL